MLLGSGHSHLPGRADWGWEQQGWAERCPWSQVGGGHGRSVPVSRSRWSIPPLSASLEGVAVPAVPLGLSSFLEKDGAGPRPPPSLPRAQPASDVCGTTPAAGGMPTGVPPPGAEGGQAPTGRCLAVVGCRSSRRSWSWLGAATAITEERLVGQDRPRARPFCWETQAQC